MDISSERVEMINARKLPLESSKNILPKRNLIYSLYRCNGGLSGRSFFIVATPTGSTAYSLSAGGAILCPDINAFSVIPLSAHYFTLRQVVFSAESECLLELSGGLTGGLLADGNLVAEIKQGESVKVFAAPEPTVFLRRKNFNFFQRLSHKFTDRAEGK